MNTPSKARYTRYLCIVLIAAGVASAANFAVVWWMNVNAPPAPPVAPILVEQKAIRELERMAVEQPRDADWPLRLGQAYQDEGHYMSAVEAFRKALKLGSESAFVHQALAVCLTRLERFEEAEKEQAKVIQLNPTDLAGELGMIQIHITKGDSKRALAGLKNIRLDESGYPVKIDPAGKYAALERIASMYGVLEEWDRAYALALKVLKDAGSRPDANVIAARHLLQKGNAKTALGHLRAALSNRKAPPELDSLFVKALLTVGGPQNETLALSRIQEMATANTATGEDFYQLGELLEKRKQWGPAARAFDRAGRLRTRTGVSLKKAYENFERAQLREDAIYARGYYHESFGDYRTALSAYEGLTKIHSCCQSGYMHVARMYRLMEQPQKAVGTLQKALRQPNPPPKVYSELATSYESAKRLPEQKATWERFIGLDEQNADLGYQKLGLMASDAGDAEEAERLYRKSIELQPTADLYRIRLAKLLLERHNDPARLQEAIHQLEEAQKSAPANPDIFFQLGIAYQYAGRKQEAIQALRHCIDLDPGDGKPFQPLAQLLTDVGDREGAQFALGMYKRYRDFYRAWETLRARVGRNPRDVAARRTLARFYDHSGALVDALGAYTKVLDLDPSDQHARKRVTELYRELGQQELDTAARTAKTAKS
jgi:tetratricopeptide (TPR) repeat protein